MANEPTKVDDGGLAQNMSLRDWYAGQALANLYTASHIDAGKIAHHAFRLADAMLIQREYSEAAEPALPLGAFPERRGGLTPTGETQ